MIEFKGHIGDKDYKIIYKRFKRGMRYVTVFVWCAFCLPLFIIALLVQDKIFWTVFAGLAGACTLLTSIGFIFPQIVIRKKDMITNLPVKVSIDESTIRRFAENGIYASRELEDVKKILDMGSFYHFVFYFPHKDIGFICQKNLIEKGTIEEFETRFQHLIQRK